MPFSLIIKEEAHRDADAAYDYYESRQIGLGERFLGALVARYVDLSQHPQFYSYIAEDPKQLLRHVKLDDFPYVVIYEISEPAEIIIYAIHNTHRDPTGRTNK